MITIPLAVQEINEKLKRDFGYFESGDKPNFRLVWSDDQYEMREGTYDKFDDNGNWIGEETGVLEVPKYSQWMPHQWTLERLCIVPEVNTELKTKLSYEPLWGFKKFNRTDLIPDYDVIFVFLDNLMSRIEDTKQGRNVQARYKMPWWKGNTKEAIEFRAKKLREAMDLDGDDLVNNMHLGGATFVDSTKVFTKDN